MNESTRRFFKQVIRERYGVDSSYHRTDPVSVDFENKRIWSGLVHVFTLHQHPDSTYCFTWDELHPEGDKHRTFTILDYGEDVTAEQAVQLSLVKRKGWTRP